MSGTLLRLVFVFAFNIAALCFTNPAINKNHPNLFQLFDGAFSAGQFTSKFKELNIKSLKGISLIDITSDIRDFIKQAGVNEGTLSLL